MQILLKRKKLIKYVPVQWRIVFRNSYLGKRASDPILWNMNVFYGKNLHKSVIDVVSEMHVNKAICFT